MEVLRPRAERPDADPHGDRDPDSFVQRHLRHNLVALGLDFGLFMVGLSLASQSTILPAFAEHLGAPNVAIGAIPAVMTVGWMLPSLFAAGHTESLRRKMPFVLRWTAGERAPFLGLAAVAFFLADRAPALSLALTLLMLLVITGVGGLLMPAWMDVVGRTVPTTLRGRFFAASSAFGNVGGLLGSLGTAWVLATVPRPGAYGVCFLGAALFMALSWWALLQVREPATTSPARAEPLREYLRRVPALVRRDHNLAWFLVARWCAVAAQVGMGFFTVHALRAHAAPEWQAGVFTTVMLAGQIAGNLALGWLADRRGHRASLLIGVTALTTGNLLALVAPTLGLLSLAFALAGLYHAAVHVSAMSILLEFAPSPGERPTYVGLGNTATGPVAFAAPLLGGLLGDWVGLPPVFALSAAAGAAALAVLATRVRDPRHPHGAPR